MEEIDIEIRGKSFCIQYDADWHLMECESSSDCGDQWVTESWKEVRVEEIQIVAVFYLTDSDEYKEIPINSLSKEDIMIVNDAIEQQINDEQ